MIPGSVCQPQQFWQAECLARPLFFFHGNSHPAATSSWLTAAQLRLKVETARQPVIDRSASRIGLPPPAAMLTKRIIPCLDVDRGRVVKGINFLQLRDAGDPVEVARRYEEDGADELVFLDISASHEGRAILLEVVRRVSEEIFMPFTVGGGIRTLEDATCLIQAGAEKVSINSAAVKTPELITEVSRKFGRCATVVNIDPRRVQQKGSEVWEVYINGGRVPTGLEAVAWARLVEELGAGEIVLT